MIIDTHAHLMFDQFKGEVDEILKRAQDAGVSKIVNIGCSVESSLQAHEMSLQYDSLYATVGLHPYDAADVNEELFDKWKELIDSNEKIIAIGECGLDYLKAKVPKDVQMKAFRRQLEFAREVSLPVVIHNREADDDTLEMLLEFDGSDGKERVNAVFHCYGSDVNFARKLWYHDYFVSFTGILTYPGSDNLLEVVKEVPMDRFMVETDCPYLAPQKYRGERNEPSYVAEVVAELATLRGLPVDEVARQSTENALKFFFRMNR